MLIFAYKIYFTEDIFLEKKRYRNEFLILKF
jgi:hypothetical protein